MIYVCYAYLTFYQNDLLFFYESPDHCKQNMSTQKVRKGILVGKIMQMELAHGLFDVGYTKSHI